jgi:hypothetical protein
MMTEKFYVGYNDSYTRRKSITPFSEAMRLLAWQEIYDEKVGEFNTYQPIFAMILADYGVSPGTWDKYMRHFYEYHRWLTEIPEVKK